MKYKRHSKILKIINEKDIQTQDRMTEELREAGFEVTQATVSRDIKELGLIKVPSGHGAYKYAVPGSAAQESMKSLDMFSGAVISVDSALHTIVIKTFPGMANAVAATVDTMTDNHILGSIAGDDTILIICETENMAKETAIKLNKIFK